MTPAAPDTAASRNIALYPWFKFLQGLSFWQAVWFLYLQSELSAAEAILLYAIYDVATTILEVPSGYMSDRLGRRMTLIASTAAGMAGAILLGIGGGFAVFALAQVLIGVGAAFASGTDSALLYESLAAEGRTDETEAQEVRAWRFMFVALALSAVTGGVIAQYSGALPFFASAVAFAGALVIALQFAEPARARVTEIMRAGSLGAALRHPVLTWLFVLSLLMYVFSHVPFIFGQPFILQALADHGWDGAAPTVSGLVTTVMMGLSVAVSLVAVRVRHWLGLTVTLLFAFGMQIALAAVLAVTSSAIAIAFLFLRMVPDSLSKPFILARIQPLVGDESRATYLSLQSLAGRVIFAGTLFAASLAASDVGEMQHSEMQSVLAWYVAAGLACFAGLALVAQRLRIEPDTGD